MICRVEDDVIYKQTWTASGMLKKVQWNERGDAQGSSDCAAPPIGGYKHEVTFTYDASGNRIMRVESATDMFGESSEMVTIYIDGVYEKQILTIGTTEYLDGWKR